MKQTTMLKEVGGRTLLPFGIATFAFIVALAVHFLIQGLPPLEYWQWQIPAIMTPIFLFWCFVVERIK